MKAQIITDSVSFKKVLESYIETVLAGIEVNNLYLVDVNTKLSPSDHRTNRSGIRIAKERATNKKNILILLGLESEKYLQANDPDFSGLMALANVGFVDILKVHNILPEYNRLVKGEKKEDSTAAALYTYKVLEQNIATLRHDLHYALLDTTRMESWLERARAAGLTGTQEEIIDQVKNWTPQTSGAFEGKTLEGIFVDALDTLFDSDWNLVPSVKSAIEKMAQEAEKGVTVISDSDRYQVESACKKHNIEWRNASKYALRGATLEIVVDNLTQDEFTEMYKIAPKKFIRVTEL